MIDFLNDYGDAMVRYSRTKVKTSRRNEKFPQQKAFNFYEVLITYTANKAHLAVLK